MPENIQPHIDVYVYTSNRLGWKKKLVYTGHSVLTAIAHIRTNLPSSYYLIREEGTKYRGYAETLYKLTEDGKWITYGWTIPGLWTKSYEE